MKKLITVIAILFIATSVYSQSEEVTLKKERPIIAKYNGPKYPNFTYNSSSLKIDKIVYIMNYKNSNLYYISKKFTVEIFATHKNINDEDVVKRFYINLNSLEELKYYQEIFEEKTYKKVRLITTGEFTDSNYVPIDQVEIGFN